MSEITAKRVIELLAVKHASDVFIPECKDGPTHGGGHRRLDAWVLRRSWANRAMIGYEVKVSRSDFLNDTKWTDYLPLCNEMWFVAPDGVADASELPEGVGLMRVSKNGGRLYRKVKAVHRDVTPPFDLLCYVLMRARGFHRSGHDERRDPGEAMEYWREFLKERDDAQELGHEVSMKIRRMVDHRVAETRARNRELERENKNLQRVREMLEALGVDVESYWLKDEVECALLGDVPARLRNALGRLKSHIDDTIEHWDIGVADARKKMKRARESAGTLYADEEARP